MVYYLVTNPTNVLIYDEFGKILSLFSLEKVQKVQNITNLTNPKKSIGSAILANFLQKI
jgi:hypothetical protein